MDPTVVVVAENAEHHVTVEDTEPAEEDNMSPAQSIVAAENCTVVEDKSFVMEAANSSLVAEAAHMPDTALREALERTFGI